jgi:ssDNA-binding Zn-finger/Zn-ribbon topoisomerase 1
MSRIPDLSGLKSFSKAYYKRPHCPNCNLIWEKTAIGRVIYCDKCGRPLILKDFDPYKKSLLGLLIIGLGLWTIFSQASSVLWFGGLLWGGSIIYYAFLNWDKVKELDGVKNITPRINVKSKLSEVINNVRYRKFTVVACNSCGQKLRFPKRKLLVTCPKCKNQFSYSP